jgi:hypothetical protein
MSALAGGAAVAPVVEGVNGETAAYEVVDQARVAAAVFAEPVRDREKGARRRRGAPGPVEQIGAAAPKHSLPRGYRVAYRVAADLVALAHFGFILFVVTGGFLILWKSVLLPVHLPVALYAVAIEIVGWTCPLTPLENRFRTLAGESGYEGGFIDHYFRLILYPADWERIRLLLGIGVVLLNLAAYGLVLRQRRRRRTTG